MKKIVIWDLFGGGENSLRKALKDDERFEIYTFDVLDKFETTTVVDLAQKPNELIGILNDFPKPNIVIASPLCQSFSLTATMKGGNACWKVVDNKLKIRDRSEYEGTRYDADKQRQKAILGWKCLLNTIVILNQYEPEYFYIENPMNSLIWKLVDENMGYMENAVEDDEDLKGKFWLLSQKLYKNTVNYGDYGFECMKPTTFLSNIDLKLKPRNMQRPYEKDFEHTKRGMKRSEIPTELLKEILERFVNKING